MGNSPNNYNYNYNYNVGQNIVGNIDYLNHHKNVRQKNHSITNYSHFSTNENNNINIYNIKNIGNKGRQNSIPMTVGINLNLRRVANTENNKNNNNTKKFSVNNVKNKKKIPYYLPKKKSVGRAKRNIKY